MKKKSGFQITSVTPAQISASISSNNSIAEDTESYDDLDESHTEDLSSSFWLVNFFFFFLQIRVIQFFCTVCGNFVFCTLLLCVFWKFII